MVSVSRLEVVFSKSNVEGRTGGSLARFTDRKNNESRITDIKISFSRITKIST